MQSLSGNAHTHLIWKWQILCWILYPLIYMENNQDFSLTVITDKTTEEYFITIKTTEDPCTVEKIMYCPRL